MIIFARTVGYCVSTQEPSGPVVQNISQRSSSWRTPTIIFPVLTAAAISSGFLSPVLSADTTMARDPATRYPTKSIRMVAPIAPGGSTDYLARAVAQHLSDRTGQSVIVDNRPGAGGNIGTDLVAKAPPDGYTLVCSNVSSVAINVSLYKSMPYDPAKDLAPITMVAVFPNVIVTQASFPAKTIKELIALAKAKPGQLTFASAGSGSSTHLGPELLNTMAGIGLRHVPYRGGGPALVAVMANEVSLYFSSIVAATGHIQTGRLSALGVTSLQRWSTLPNIPTVAESGFPGFEALNWSGILAPAATPNSVVAFLNREIVSGLRSKEMVAQLMSQGARATPMNPEEFRQYIAAEILKWAKVVKASGASAN